MKLMKRVTIVTVALSTTASIALAAQTASAATASTRTTPAAVAASDRSPWKPYRSAPFVDAPGAVCSFGVTGTPVRDKEQVRTLKSFPNGDPEVQEFRGPLYYRYTNDSTGRSVVRNLSGIGYFDYQADGGVDALFLSHGGLTIPIGNKGFRAGEWVFSGQLGITISAAGNIAITIYHGHAEDMCHTLA